MAFEQHSDNLRRSSVWKLFKMQQVAREEKGCSKGKKLLESSKVAKKLPSNLWKALSLGQPQAPRYASVLVRLSPAGLGWVTKCKVAHVHVLHVTMDVKLILNEFKSVWMKLMIPEAIMRAPVDSLDTRP